MKFFLSIINFYLFIHKIYFVIVIKFDHQISFVESNHFMNPFKEKNSNEFSLTCHSQLFFNCIIIFSFKDSMWMAIPINKFILKLREEPKNIMRATKGSTFETHGMNSHF